MWVIWQYIEKHFLVRTGRGINFFYGPAITPPMPRPRHALLLAGAPVILFPGSAPGMRVNLAAQVMSETVGKVMLAYATPKAKETAKLILLVDKFFDCCNTRSLNEGVQKRKPFLKPYTSVDDERFKFMKEEFLKYLADLKDVIENRKGNFKSADREKMFLTRATYEGLQTTAHALIECVQYLLQNGFKYVLTNKLSQDPLEDHFRRHRGLGRRSCNPTIHALGHQENKLRVQRSIATSITPKGNTKGSKRPKEGITITTSPLKRRKK